MQLEDYLATKRLSDQAFADRVGVSQSYISRLRRRMVIPSLETALRIQREVGPELDLLNLLPPGRAQLVEPAPAPRGVRHRKAVAV
jgi:transcriptional regulator with XRE-family HTH domain